MANYNLTKCTRANYLADQLGSIKAAAEQTGVDPSSLASARSKTRLSGIPVPKMDDEDALTDAEADLAEVADMSDLIGIDKLIEHIHRRIEQEMSIGFPYTGGDVIADLEKFRTLSHASG